MFKLRALFIHIICVHVDRQTGQGKARPLAAAAADTNSNNDDNIRNLMHNPKFQTSKHNVYCTLSDSKAIQLT